MKLDLELLRRGQERYEIFCSPCHGATGSGNGVMTQYGMVGVATITDAFHARMPEGEYFNVITNGKGRMLGYGPQIKVRRPLGDRRLHSCPDAEPECKTWRCPRGQASGVEPMTHARRLSDNVSLPATRGRILVVGPVRAGARGRGPLLVALGKRPAAVALLVPDRPGLPHHVSVSVQWPG